MSYKVDLRAVAFTLYEHLKVQELFALDAYAHLSRQDCDQVIRRLTRGART